MIWPREAFYPCYLIDNSEMPLPGIRIDALKCGEKAGCSLIERLTICRLSPLLAFWGMHTLTPFIVNARGVKGERIRLHMPCWS